MFAKRVFQSEELTLNSLCVIPISKNNLVPVAQAFKDVETDDDVAKSNGARTSPRELMQTLFTIMSVVYDPQLGCPVGDIDENSRRHTFERPNGEVADKVSVYLEFVYSVDNVHLGWRVFIVACDPAFNLDKGLTKLFENEAKRRAAESRSRTGVVQKDPFPIAMFTRRKTWILSGINSYLQERFQGTTDDHDFNQDANKAIHFPLFSNDSPACAHKVFTFARSCAAFPTAAPNYLNEAAYLSAPAAAAAAPNQVNDGSDDDSDDEMGLLLNNNAGVNLNAVSSCVTFPHSALVVLQEAKKPNVFFTWPVNKEPTDEELSMSADQLRAMRWRIMEIDNAANMHDQVLETTRAYMRSRSEGMDAVQYRALCLTVDVKDMFISAVHKCTSMPGTRIAAMYVLDKIRDGTKPYIPCVESYDSILDNKLTPFGNMVATELYRIELVCAVLVLHVEMFMMLLITLLATDVDHNEMGFHLFLMGPAGSGKSYLQGVLDDCTIPGLIFRVGSQSAKANTTEVNRNGHIAMLDELNSMFTGKGEDGTGNSLLKELLTRGRSTDIICQVEDGRKKEIETELNKKATIIGNANIEVDKMPAPMVSRAYAHCVPIQRRPEVEAVAENQRMRTDPKRIASKAKMTERWRFIQSIAALVHFKVSCLQFKPIDMRLVSKIASNVFVKLQADHGIDIHVRDKERIMLLTRMLTIYDAITEVWFSGRVLKPNTAFAITQLDLLIPYLTCTREHFIFAMTMMDDVISDPSIPIILQAMQSLIMMERVATNRFGKNDSARDRGDADKPDYDYYAITIRCAGVNDSHSGILYMISEKIASLIKTDTSCEFTAAHIMFILRKLLARTVMAFPFVDADSQDMSRTERLPVLVVKRVGMSYSVEISRQYLHDVIYEKKDVLLNAVIATIDPEFPVDTLVLGRTYRYGYKTAANRRPQPFPFLFETFDASAYRGAAEPILLEREVFRRFAHDILDGDSDDEGNGEMLPSFVDERIYVADGVLEDQYLESWCEMNGIGVPPKRDVRTRNYRGNYPQSFVDGYNAEFRGQLARHPATTTTTTTGGGGRAAPKRGDDSDASTPVTRRPKSGANPKRGAGYGDESDASTPVTRRPKSGANPKRGAGYGDDSDAEISGASTPVTKRPRVGDRQKPASRGARRPAEFDADY